MSVFTVRDVAQMMNKSEETIKRYIRAGKFPNAFKISDKEGWRIPQLDLDGQTYIPSSDLSSSSEISMEPDEQKTIISLAYQAVTLTQPTSEVINELSLVGIKRAMEILLVMRLSPTPVRNPLGFIRKAIRENWNPNDIPVRIHKPQQVSAAEHSSLDSEPKINFPFYNWLEDN